VFDNCPVAPRVIVELVHELADLHAWGRSGGTWWALVSWSTYGSFKDGGTGYLYSSAWVPARYLRPSADPEMVTAYQAVQRFDLPEDRSVWPCPAASAGRRWKHYGALETEPPPAPEIAPLAPPRRSAPGHQTDPGPPAPKARDWQPE
jgi:hypothetical protein